MSTMHCSTCHLDWPDYKTWFNHKCSGHNQIQSLRDELAKLKEELGLEKQVSTDFEAEAKKWRKSAQELYSDNEKLKEENERLKSAMPDLVNKVNRRTQKLNQALSELAELKEAARDWLDSTDEDNHMPEWQTLSRLAMLDAAKSEGRE